MQREEKTKNKNKNKKGKERKASQNSYFPILSSTSQTLQGRKRSVLFTFLHVLSKVVDLYLVESKKVMTYKNKYSNSQK